MQSIDLIKYTYGTKKDLVIEKKRLNDKIKQKLLTLMMLQKKT